jgi:phosphoserine phosphatase RsbU/P
MGDNPIRILIVEDNNDDAVLLQHSLNEGPRGQFELTHVEQFGAALKALRDRTFDVALLDLHLPDSQGVDTFLQFHRHAPMIPVVVLTGLDDETAAITAAKEGAQDYLVKGQFNRNLLVRAIRYAIERKRTEREMANYARQLRLKNEQMEADLELAREVQMALLPQKYPMFPHNAAPADSKLSFCGRYQPATTLGGDFYDVFAMSDSAAGVLVCDVMGHGVRAGLLTAMIRALMGELTTPDSGVATDPGRLLAQINRGLTGILKQAGTSLFVTAFYMVADVARGRYRCASAGHPCPLHVRRARQTVESVGMDYKPGPALGLFDNAAFDSFEQTMDAGDLVMLFTDGLFEVAGPSGELYGEKRLLDMVQHHFQLPTNSLFDTLLAEVRKFSHPRDLADDICLVGMDVTRIG